jgi:hypothetical protein
MEDDNSYHFPELGYTIIIFLVVCIFGVISQVLLIIALIKDPLKCFKNSGTYLVGNLAVSDFLTCLLSPFVFYVPKNWVLQFAVWSSVGVSNVTLASISLDRFLLVVYPLKHRVLMERKVVIVWLACIWLISSVFPMRAFLLSIRNDMDPVVMSFVEGTLIIFASVMYGFTYYTLKKQSKNFALQNVSNRQQQARVMKEKRFLRTIILLACIAVICVVPPSIFYQYAALQNLLTDDVAAPILFGILSCLFFVNYAVNPLVYVLRLPNYRKTFYLVYCCKTTAR